MHVNDLLQLMTQVGASDLHLKPSRPPLVRVNGHISALDAPPPAASKA